MNQAKQPTLYPQGRDLLGHTIEAIGLSPRIKHVVTFDYPDATRTYDGEGWKVTAKPPVSGLCSTVTGAAIQL